MINTKMLRAKIYGEYGSQARFSEVIGWNSNKTSRILRNVVTPDINSCAIMAKKLNLSREKYFDIFLPNFTPIGDNPAS